MKYNRNKTVWITQYGDKKLVKDLEDSHVQNIVQFLPNSGHAGNQALIRFFNKELKIRNLKPISHQVPHLAPSGRMKRWDEEYRVNASDDELANMKLIDVLVKARLIDPVIFDDYIWDVKNDHI